jgi:hypothetical protein
VSAQISEQTSQFYVGTLNGVMYRIGPGAMTPGGKLFALEPFEALSVPVAARPAIQRDATPPGAEAPVPETPAPVAASETIARTTQPERATAAVTLFKREGAEPLRAGHPDLWALLVRGTSLDGTSFQAAAAS